MKKAITLFLTLALLVSSMAACSSGSTASSSSQTSSSSGSEASSSSSEASSETPAAPVELAVVTSYGGDDGNRTPFEKAVADYEAQSGNKIKNASAFADEAWKARVMTDFETGAEPDVLFYYNGADSSKLVEGGKVVSVDEIRKVYPDYASNMKDEMLGASPVDGKNYSIPCNGYWEGMFVNKKVLADSGVEVPGANYTWDQFLADCEKIKAKGYDPLACSLNDMPHYWFEYMVYNHRNVNNMNVLPKSADDDAGKAWVAGISDIKSLYEKGYFPKNTTTATDAETCQLMLDNKAAFHIDGSWKLGWYQENAANIEDFAVTYPPVQGERKSTDIIGGLSMGYFITTKAWNDPAKQKACVDFIEYMTKNEVVATFGATAITALKDGVPAPTDADGLVTSALAFTKGASGISPAVEDNLSQNARTDLFVNNMKNIVTGTKDIAEAINAALAIK